MYRKDLRIFVMIYTMWQIHRLVFLLLLQKFFNLQEI